MPFKDPEEARKYRADWYLRHRAEEIAAAYRNKRRTIRRNQELTEEIRRSTPCSDCGVSYPPYVMDFDHIRGTKVDDVMQLVNQGASWVKISAEIAKCEVVCSNCHRIRTYQRRQSADQQSRVA